MPSPTHHRLAVAAYLLLASTYLLYLPHAEFVLDDWFVLGKYQAAREAGPAELIKVAGSIVQNQFHGQFRFQWVSFVLEYLVWLVAGYSPKVVFLLSLALHLACAMAWRGGLEKLGLGAPVAFLSGAVFLLLPATHGALLWSFNCAYYLWSSFWFLLYLRSLAGSLKAGRLEKKDSFRQAIFLLLAMFSGDPVFGLLLAAAPILAWFQHSKLAVRAALLAWGTVAAGAASYALLINKADMIHRGLGLRYDFSLHTALATLAIIASVYSKMTGLTADSYYQLRFSGPAVLAGLIAVGTVVFCLRRAPRPRISWRAFALAAAFWGAAYGPILFLRAHEFRYDYVPSPYLALALSLAALPWPVLRLPLAALLGGWLAMASVADLEQSWIPQSRHLRAIASKLESLGPIESGDLIIVSNTTLWIGTAPHFAFMAGWASTPFAEHVTGVRGVEAACDIVEDAGRLRVRHWNYMRDLKPDESRRTRVLVVQKDSQPAERHLLAREIHPGAYRLYPLKGYTGPSVPGEPCTRDQLAMFESDIYFVQRL